MPEPERTTSLVGTYSVTYNFEAQQDWLIPYNVSTSDPECISYNSCRVTNTTPRILSVRHGTSEETLSGCYINMLDLNVPMLNM